MDNFRLLGLATGALIATACHHEPTAPAFGATLLTDQGSYVATPAGGGAESYYKFTVITRYANKSGAPIYLDRCGGSTQPSAGVQAIGADGTPIGSTDNIASACAGSPPLAIQAGDVRTDTLTLATPSGPPARVRLFYLASNCAGLADICSPLLPEPDRTSNIVELQAAP